MPISASERVFSAEITNLEPQIIIVRDKDERNNKNSDRTNNSWWDKLTSQWRDWQIETEFVDDGMEKTIKGEKSFVILILFLLGLLFFWNNWRDRSKNNSLSRSSFSSSRQRYKKPTSRKKK